MLAGIPHRQLAGPLPRRQAVTVSAGGFAIRHAIEGDVLRFTTGRAEGKRALSLYYCTPLLDLAPGKAVGFVQTLTVAPLV